MRTYYGIFPLELGDIAVMRTAKRWLLAFTQIFILKCCSCCLLVLFLTKKFINYIYQMTEFFINYIYQLSEFCKRPLFSLVLKFAKVVSPKLDGKMPSPSQSCLVYCYVHRPWTWRECMSNLSTCNLFPNGKQSQRSACLRTERPPPDWPKMLRATYRPQDSPCSEVRATLSTVCIETGSSKI